MERLERALDNAHEKIQQLEAQLSVAQQAACVVLGLNFEELRKQINGIQK